VSVATELTAKVRDIMNATWNSRTGQVVPEQETVALANGAVQLDAVFLYADLARSTQLARDFDPSVAAKIVKSFLSSVTRLIRLAGGEVRSFDGDRVMGVFIGAAKETAAATCALKINYAVKHIVRPQAEAQFPSLTQKGFVFDHCTGIAGSPVLVVRGGIRNNNDLVFVGAAPNLAAKLSQTRNGGWSTYMTWNVHAKLDPSARYGGAPRQDMWAAAKCTLGVEQWDCFASTWWWQP